jgi:hypothetical protein
MRIIALIGFAGSGKSTAASMLHASGYRSLSFADLIKDCLAAIFGWERDLLEGSTPESRTFRDTVDPWWAARLGIAGFTPRHAMQQFGTEIMRQGLHPDIWLLAMERRLDRLTAEHSNQAVVFPDTRFPNEMQMTERLGGQLVRIRRGAEPDWFDLAVQANAGDAEARRMLHADYHVHDSECAWIGRPVHRIVQNDGSLADLRVKILALA